MSETVWLIDDQDRYDRLRLIAWWEQERIRRARVLVVGAGALGNEVVKNLVLLGVGTIYIIDFDRIEASNLSRSVFFRESDRGQGKAQVLASRAGELNPDSRLVPVHGDVMLDVGLGWVRSLDAVIGCLDNREARLWVNRLCWKANVPWIDGGIQELNGVVKVYQPPDGACYECTMTANDYRLIQLRYSCPLLKREDIQAGRVPTAPTIASMIGAWQVQEFLKLLHKIPTDTGTALVFNGLANLSYKSRLPRREDCLSHETYTDIQSTNLTHHSPVAEMLSEARRAVNQDVTLVLDRDWVQELVCDVCRRRIPMGQTMGRVSSAAGLCACGQALRPVTRHEIHQAFLCESLGKAPGSAVDPDLRLCDLGIPDWDILKWVTRGGDEYFWELTAVGDLHRPALPCSGSTVVAKKNDLLESRDE